MPYASWVVFIHGHLYPQILFYTHGFGKQFVNQITTLEQKVGQNMTGKFPILVERSGPTVIHILVRGPAHTLAVALVLRSQRWDPSHPVE